MRQRSLAWVSNRWTGFSTGTGMGLERGTGLFDWNVGLDYWTGTLSTEIHLPRMPETVVSF